MSLFNDSISDPDALLEQWGKCIEMANASSDKRISSNNTFLTIEAALLAVTSFTGNWENILLAAIGVVVSIFWLVSIRSYKILNSVKYQIINELEEKLPSSPFKEEWDRLQKKKRYALLTSIEKMLPVLFVVLFSIIIVVASIKLILPLLCTCVTSGKGL